MVAEKEITYEAVTEWGSNGWYETGDLNAYYTNSYGANLHGYIWLGPDDVTVGVTGISSKIIPFGRDAALSGAIGNPAYRAKVIETAKQSLREQFEVTNAAKH